MVMIISRRLRSPQTKFHKHAAIYFVCVIGRSILAKGKNVVEYVKMGGAVSFIKGHGRRLVNRYNAQYRALEFIERGDLPVAPKHPLPKVLRGQEVPSPEHELHSKSDQLNEYLKNVYIRSYDEVKEESSVKSKRPMPQYREEQTELFPEPPIVTPGYCTLTQAVKFLVDHYEDPETNSAAAIGERHDLNVQVVENILKFHTIFQSHDMSSLKSQYGDGGATLSGEDSFIGLLTKKMTTEGEPNIFDAPLQLKELFNKIVKMKEKEKKKIEAEKVKKEAEKENSMKMSKGEEEKKEYQSGI